MNGRRRAPAKPREATTYQPPLYAACRHTPQCPDPLAGLERHRWPDPKYTQTHKSGV